MKRAAAPLLALALGLGACASPGEQTSAPVEPICEALGLAPPLVDLDPAEVDTLDDYRQLSEADRQVVRDLIAALRKRKGST